jgi:hypothetical protein
MVELTRAEFEKRLAALSTRFTDATRPFIAHLSGKDTDALLAAALEHAWDTRAGLNPKSPTIIGWWSKCLRAAARTRPQWALNYSVGVRYTSGHLLGRTGPNGEY